ncbi:MAG: hypothetical protein PHW53_02455 [Patescibacteria group bacterium]|nr:hypothetical protein [Patescibacteria group bacterium]
MRFDLKKILIIILFIAAAAAAGYGVYYFFFKPAETLEITTVEEVTPTSELPEAGLGTPTTEVTEGVTPVLPTASPIASGGITQVENLTPTVSVSSAALSGDGQGMNFYDPTNGRLNKVLPDGTVQSLSSQTFYNVEKVNWSGDSASAILEYPDGSNILYDLQSKKQITLPKHWEDFDFSPQGDKIVAKSMGLDEENRWLIVANKDGSDAEAIEPLGNNGDKVQVKWSPNNQIIATSRTGEAMGINRQQVLLVGKNNENFPGLVIEGWGFDYEWSPTGERMVYNAYNMDSNYNPVLWVVDASGENIGANRKSLKVNTWADKCTFADNSTAYCAVPDYLPEGAGLQRDLANGIPDTIYKIDLASGRKTTVGKPEDASTIKQITLSSDGKYLFYVDQATSRLNKMRLK